MTSDQLTWLESLATAFAQAGAPGAARLAHADARDRAVETGRERRLARLRRLGLIGLTGRPFPAC